MLAALTCVFALTALAYFLLPKSRTNTRAMPAPLHAAYILENQVAHARLLPAAARHAFAYPTLALLLSLDALDAHALDLARGRLFGYGAPAGRLTAVRAAAYLLPDPALDGRSGKEWGMKDKLREVLARHGQDAGALGKAWMLTMPSYLGFEGINPLTVHYCYLRGDVGAEQEERLGWVILEVRLAFALSVYVQVF